MGTATASMRAWMLGPDEGEIMGPEEGGRDRFLVDRTSTGGRFSLVEHLLAPRLLAAPLHLHTREDEVSYILEGRVGALLGEEELVAEPGSVIFKPRGQWHTFWNAGDEPATALEIISPGGLEQLFRRMATMGEIEPEALAELATEFACDVDFEATGPIVERHRLSF